MGIRKVGRTTGCHYSSQSVGILRLRELLAPGWQVIERCFPGSVFLTLTGVQSKALVSLPPPTPFPCIPRLGIVLMSIIPALNRQRCKFPAVLST